MLFSLEAGDEVAVLPEFGATASQTLEIAPIIHVFRMLITLPGNRVYGRVDGCPVGSNGIGYIVPATDAHRDAARINTAAIGAE